VAKRNPNAMSFFDHLEELRQRIIHSIIAIVVAFVACYIVEPYVMNFLIHTTLVDASDTLALLAPLEGFNVKLKLSFIMSLIVASPVIFWQFWTFVSPGLYRHEKRYVLPIVSFSTVCFIAGSAFSLVILPYATKFFQSFAMNGIRNTWSLSKYIDFLTRMILAFGLIFELPIVVFFLAKLGIVTPKFLWSKFRYAIVVILIISAVLTPGPDVFSQIALATPLTILYVLSIFLSMMAVKKSTHHKTTA
jgi:sec-independent protein translocase protein TatC